MIRFYKSLYFSNRLYLSLTVLVCIFIIGQFVPFFFYTGQFLLLTVLILLLLDIFLLFKKSGIEGQRTVPNRFSNGDANQVEISILNQYDFAINTEIIDEAPNQFQHRNLKFQLGLKPNESKNLSYKLTPKERGEYEFGYVLVYVNSQIRLIKRRFNTSKPTTVKTYPSFLNLQKYELIAASRRLKDYGPKRLRKIGQSTEFDHIKEYTIGDDTRKINWTASARRNHLMVNHFVDERSQSVYSIIDKGRTMKMPFEGLSLLDYAINASLVISNVALKKEDKVGLISFEDKVESIVPASKKENQMAKLMEALYAQKTSFQESDFSNLFLTINSKVQSRSLLLLYTNFESTYSLKRQLSFLKKIARKHLLLIIYFENTEIKKLTESKSQNLQDIYYRVIAESFEFEKRQMAKYLNQHGINTLLTTPQNLSIDLINKYLELKRSVAY
ncbi:MAG: DUF58 domain-containing protein [Bacteroidota bacterium]